MQKVNLERRWVKYLIFGMAISGVGVVAICAQSTNPTVPAAKASASANSSADSRMLEIETLMYAFHGKVDIYLSPEEVASGKPSISQVQGGGDVDTVNGEKLFYFRSDATHHWLVNPHSIVAVKETDSK